MLGATAAAACAVSPKLARARTRPRFFRIATGSATGTYFPIGSLIAEAISSPPGTPNCEEGGRCGVDGLVAAALTTRGSLDNVERVAAGEVESGLAQADVLYWAMSGGEFFAAREPMPFLRAIASLYPEALHIVVREGVEAASPADLRGLRVALDEEGSGTLVDARLLLDGFGLSEEDIEPFYIKALPAAALMAKGEIDAFFMVGGWPLTPVREAISQGARLLPVDHERVTPLVDAWPFLSRGHVPANAYDLEEDVETLLVSAVWFVRRDLDDGFVLDLTRALWHPQSIASLMAGHPRGKDLDPMNALAGLGIPLHPGAARYYREAAILRGG